MVDDNNNDQDKEKEIANDSAAIPTPTPTSESESSAPATSDVSTSEVDKPRIDTSAKPLPKRKAMSITIRDKNVLYAAYMSFLKYGGLFIPTKKSFTMGELCTLIIILPGDTDKYNVNGKVVWITPPISGGNKAGGIGIEFADDRDGERLRRRIEEILGPLLQSNNATHTM